MYVEATEGGGEGAVQGGGGAFEGGDHCGDFGEGGVGDGEDTGDEFEAVGVPCVSKNVSVEA